MNQKEPLAVFTIVKNEGARLAWWLDYYTEHVGEKHVYVLEHDSVPSSNNTESWRRSRLWTSAEANRVPVHHYHSFDHMWLAKTVSQFQRFLLQSYAAVLFTEVDEIVTPAGFGNLPGYAALALSDIPYVRCSGYEVVDRDEPELDARAPLLAQRKWWYPTTLYSKTLLSKIPMHWGPGFHTSQNVPDGHPRATDLILLHLHKVDFKMALSRHQASAQLDWSAKDLDAEAGWQNRLIDETQLKQWFEANIDNTDEPAPFEEMPDWIREVI